MFYIIVALQILATLLYVAYLIEQYSLQQVNLAVKTLVYLTWLASFIIVVLLPYDIYNSMQSDFDMAVIWKVVYNLIMVLTWVLLPIAQEYQTAGEFTTKARLRTAVINNLIIYGIIAILAGAFLIYLYIKDQLNLQELMPLLLAASNAFGMFLVVIFLSHGLVGIPKALWREKKLEIKLKQRQFNAVGLARKKQKVIQQLQLKAKELFWFQKKKGQTPQSNYISNLIPQKYRQKWRKNVPDLGQIDIIKVHKQVKELLLQLARLQRRWEELSQQTFMIEDIIANAHNPLKKIQSTLIQASKYELLNNARWLWNCKIKPLLHPALAIFFSLFAGAVIIAELSIFIPALSFLNPFSRLLAIQNFIFLDCSLIIVMGYIVFCVYYALFKLRFASYYGLYWNKQTDASSLMFFAVNGSRISTPLCYNFLQIINNKKTAFSKVMGETDIVPVFGQTFYYIFPILLILLIVINVFDVYTLIARMFNLQKFEFQSDFSHQNIEQGKRLLQKARTELENKILNSNSKDLSEYRSYKWETGLGSQSSTNKENFSSEPIALKGSYFNNFGNIEMAKKVMNL